MTDDTEGEVARREAVWNAVRKWQRGEGWEAPPGGDDPIVAFIRARIAADEVAAGAAIDADYWVQEGLRWGHVGSETERDLVIDPARVLVECASKLRTLDRFTPVGDAHDECRCEGCRTLVDLAATYAYHPDYRDDWGL